MDILVGIAALAALQALLCYATYRYGVKRTCILVEEMFYEAGKQDVLREVMLTDMKRMIG